MSSLIQYIQQILQWLVDFLLWIPHKTYALIMDGLAAVVEAIPVPGWASNIPNYLAGLDGGVAWFAGTLQLGTGITIVFGAYVLRFLIRRIPFIG